MRKRLTGPGDGSTPRIAVLCGLGGVGKTSLAIEYAYRQAASLSIIWQFAAEDPLTLKTGFSELATALGVSDLADPVAAVHSALAARTGWLLLFDNVTDLESVTSLLPPSGDGQVLITTQNRHWPTDQLIDIPVLDDDTSADFLTARTAAPTERTIAEALAAKLGGLPLALEQAAAYITTSGLSMTSYLDLFTTRRAELLSRGQAAGYDKQVTTTWSLAFDQLKTTPAAITLLRLFACCAPESIPYDLLLRPIPGFTIDPIIAPLLKPLLYDKLAVADAVAALRSYSLIGPPTNGTVSVHRLVQAVTLAGLSPADASAWPDTVEKLITAALPTDPQLPPNWLTYSLLARHAQAVLAGTSEGLMQVANYLGYAGNYAAARDLSQPCADARLAKLGPNHPHTLTARHNLASWTGEAGDPAAARDQLAALLPDRERILGPDHPGTLAARHNLAYWTGEAGDPAAARDQLAALLPDRERVLGPDHPSTHTTRRSLAYWSAAAESARSG